MNTDTTNATDCNVMFHYQTLVVAYPPYKLSAVWRDHGRICLALQRPSKDRDKTQESVYRAAFSFCHPKDQFVKKTARHIAGGRLQSKHPKNSFEFTMPGDATLKQVMQKAFDIAMDPKHVVGKAKGGFKDILFAPTWVVEEFENQEGLPPQAKLSPGFR